MTIVLGIIIVGGLLWFIYSWILEKQWWFYHARRIFREIQDKLDR